jgi:tripartite-type tricarboxylate transporter receptor subunit TctC
MIAHREHVARRPSRRSVGGMVALALLTTGSTNAVAQSVKDFYTGRQIKFVVGTAGGGGYEFYSRLIARHITGYIPGNPTFVVQVMPGAAGMAAANYLYNIAPHDGSEMGMMGRAVGTQPLLDPKDSGPKYVATRFNWIGSPQQEVGLVIARTTSSVHTMEDLRLHELVVSGTSTAAPPSLYPRMLNRLLGTKFKVVEGYKSSQEALLAVERGEVDGHVSGSSTSLIRERIAPWIRDGKAKIVAQIGLEKDPELGDVPLVMDFATKPTERQVLELLLAQQAMAWPILMPPDVPADRVKAFRDAFDATMKDPEFLAEASKQRLIINPVGGEKILALLERVYAAPKDVLDVMTTLTGRN